VLAVSSGGGGESEESLMASSNIHKYTAKEVLNLVLQGASAVGVQAYTVSEALNLVIDTSSTYLNVGLYGGTITGDVTITGDLTVQGSSSVIVDDIVQGNMFIGGTEDDVTGGTTDGSPTLNATGEFASATAGDIVKITASATAPHTTFRIVTVTDNDNVELDRNVTAGAGDVDFTIFYDAVVIESDTDTDVASMHVGGELRLNKGSQNYLFTDRSDSLAIQGQDSGSVSVIDLFSKDGDGTDFVSFGIWGVGSPSVITDRERVELRYNPTGVFELVTEWASTGASREQALALSTMNSSGVNNANQLYLATGGQNIMGHNASIAIAGSEQKLQLHSTSTPTIGLARYTAGSGGSTIYFAKSRGATIGDFTKVEDNDIIMRVVGAGADDTDFVNVGAEVIMRANKQAANNDVGADIELWTSSSGATADLSTVLHGDAMLDLYGGTISILAGAQDGAKTRTNGTLKRMRFGIPHFNTSGSELPMAVLYGLANSADNTINIGGGANTMNAATIVAIHVADNVTTTTGTEVARFEGGATKALKMGLGNSALKGWASTYSALQIGGQGAIMSLTADDAGSQTHLMNNAYFDGGWKYIGTASNEASRYKQKNGTHTFSVFSAGTAGNALSGEVSALTIANDASSTFGGNVSINSGTLSELRLYGNRGGDAVTSNIYFYNTAGTDDIAQIVVSRSGADNSGTMSLEAVSAGTPNANQLLLNVDGSSTFGGDVSIPATNKLYFDGGSDTWIKETSADLLDIVVGNATKLSIAGTANGLITLNGGTGGVQLDNTVGIGVAPDANRTLYTDRTFTATATAYSILLSDQITGNAGSNIYGLGITGTTTLAGSGVHANVADVFLSGKALGADTGADITNLATMYIADAPSYSGTVTNGPYSIFVDAGRSRFDGFINRGSAEGVEIGGGGAIAVTSSFNRVEVNGGSGSGNDDLSTATGGLEGDEIFLMPEDSGATNIVTIKNGTGAGAFICAGGADFVMDHIDDRWHGIHNGTEWVEVSRSGNS